MKPSVKGSVVEPFVVAGGVTVEFSVFTKVNVCAAALKSNTCTTQVCMFRALVVARVIVSVAAELLVTMFRLDVIGIVAAFVVAVIAFAVNKRFVAVATPIVGVTRVGEVAKTFTPVPVLSVKAVPRFALLGVPRNVATPVPNEVIPVPPLAIAIVVPFQVPVVITPVLAVITKPLILVTPVRTPSASVMAGVVVAVATVPDTPWAVTTDTLVTVPEPETDTYVPACVRKSEEDPVEDNVTPLTVEVPIVEPEMTAPVIVVGFARVLLVNVCTLAVSTIVPTPAITVLAGRLTLDDPEKSTALLVFNPFAKTTGKLPSIVMS